MLHFLCVFKAEKTVRSTMLAYMVTGSVNAMGKTQIALELAYRVQDSSKEYSVFWMSAHSMAAFEKAAIELVLRLAIPCDVGEDPKEVLQRFLATDAAGHWLLILDNADDIGMFEDSADRASGLFDVLPSSRTGRILTTTRLSRIAVQIAGSDVVKLAEMTPEEAQILLERSLLNKSQLRQADTTEELLRKLAYLPLTVVQAAAYMNAKELPLAAYLRLCNSTDQNMINVLSDQLRDETHDSKTQGAVATTWIISFKAICESNADAARLLSFIQWIEPTAIPQTILPQSDSDWAQMQDIAALCEYGFLTWQEDGETLDMHSLVHLALRFGLTNSALVSMTKNDAIDQLNEIFPKPKWENRVLWRRYFPHVLPLVKVQIPNASQSSLWLGYLVGRCLTEDGRIGEAVEVLRSVVAIREKALAEDHPSRLASQHALALAYRANGRAVHIQSHPLR